MALLYGLIHSGSHGEYEEKRKKDCRVDLKMWVVLNSGPLLVDIKID